MHIKEWARETTPRPRYKHTCRACVEMATRAGGRCRSCEVAARDTVETRRANFAARIEKIRAGASCQRAWGGYSAERRAQVEAENPDLAAALNEIRRERQRPVHRECLTGCYLIQCETTGLVKIGHSNDVNDRLRTLRIGSPTRLAVLGVIGQDVDAGRDIEATLHARFAHRRSHGEWYALTPEELSETLCGSVVPEPGSYRSAKRAAARAAARAPRHVQDRIKAATMSQDRAAGVLSPAEVANQNRPSAPQINAHVRSWACAVGAKLYTQAEIAWLCGVPQSSVSRWLSAAGVVAVSRYRSCRASLFASLGAVDA